MTKETNPITELDQKLENASQTIDQEEVAFFANLADTWWDPNGPFKPLHKLNPTRISFIKDNITAHFNLDQKPLQPLKGLDILDIGCGGGLISEPLCRLGGNVTGIDASEKNIKTASHHASATALDINYKHTSAEALAQRGKKFDVIINMEVIEHVADISAFLAACRMLLKPGGLMLVSTLNRTAKSYVFAIIGAEYILRWLPVGAHDWKKFITPGEIETHLTKAGFTPGDKTGFIFSPFKGKWGLSARDLDVNYAITAS